MADVGIEDSQSNVQSHPFAPQPGWIKEPGRQGVALAYVSTTEVPQLQIHYQARHFAFSVLQLQLGYNTGVKDEFLTSRAIEEKSSWTTLGGISPWLTLRALTARMQNWLADWEAWAVGYVFLRPTRKLRDPKAPFPHYTIQYSSYAHS